MPVRMRPADLGSERARRIVLELGREVRSARVDRGLSQAAVGRAVGLSAAQVSRIERGLVANVSIRHVARMLAVVSLELSARAFPGGRAIRDVGHVRVLERLRSRLHPSLTWRTEVPVGGRGDLRAWDAQVRGSGFLVRVEAETRPTDLQALQRRIELKRGGVGQVVLLLPDTRHNRLVMAEFGTVLGPMFPVAGSVALRALAEGRDPGGSSVILL